MTITIIGKANPNLTHHGDDAKRVRDIALLRIQTK